MLMKNKVLIGVSALMSVCCASQAASLKPRLARRALKADPMVALKYE